jgi:hypothetical protein
VLERAEITFATLCRLDLGLGLGGPWVAQGWPKRRPRVTQGSPKGRIEEVPLFATKVEKCPGGVEKIGWFSHLEIGYRELKPVKREIR